MIFIEGCVEVIPAHEANFRVVYIMCWSFKLSLSGQVIVKKSKIRNADILSTSPNLYQQLIFSYSRITDKIKDSASF